MNIYHYKEYEIYVGEAPPHSYNSTDNKPYDKIIDIENSEFNKCIEIKVDLLGEVHIYPYGEDYILYGELEIYRISSDLKVKWEFSGRDIFVRYEGNEPALEMREDKMCLYDFSNNYYEISYDGKLII